MSDDIKYEEAIKQLEEIVLNLKTEVRHLMKAFRFLKREQSLQVFAVISLNLHSKKSPC